MKRTRRRRGKLRKLRKKRRIMIQKKLENLDYKKS
jgi:hypothetical protein